MKTISKILMVAALAFSASSCLKYDFSVDYQSPISISFTGVGDNNIAVLEKGVVDYSAQIVVKADNGISQINLYEADNRTGAAGAGLYEEIFYERTDEFTYTYDFSSLTQNKAIRVTVADLQGNSASKNLVVSLTPVVDISETGIIAETGEVYYGSYYATWLSGRVYTRSFDNIEKYKSNIDVTFGEVAGAATMMSPAARYVTFGLPNLQGLHSTKVGLTSLTKAQYDAINKTDASPIEAIADPTEESVAIAKDKVYVFLRDDGLKGLIYIEDLVAKTNTIENAEGVWEENTPYHQLAISSKSIAK